MAKNIKRMINKVGDGDFAAAEVAFDAAIQARREAQLQIIKRTLHRIHFSHRNQILVKIQEFQELLLR